MARFPGSRTGDNHLLTLNNITLEFVREQDKLKKKLPKILSSLYVYVELRHLFDLSGQHTALYPQHSGDVHVLPTHVIHPLGEAVHCRLEELPGKLYDVEHSLDDIV